MNTLADGFRLVFRLLACEDMFRRGEYMLSAIGYANLTMEVLGRLEVVKVKLLRVDLTMAAVLLGRGEYMLAAIAYANLLLDLLGDES